MKIHPVKLCPIICAAALILSSPFCFAVDCPLTDVQITGQTEKELDPAYQPGDGTVLHRFKAKPTTGGPKYPTVLMIPPTVFRSGDDHGTFFERVATKDLVDAGYLVFQIEHRLAPPGQLEGQPDHDGTASGRPPQQTDDVKRQILSALADPDCDGRIYLVGGSSGGCHALWVALDAASGNVSGWNDTIRKKIKAVVCLSAVTDLSSREHDSTGPDMYIQDFINSVENYTNTHLVYEWLQIQKAASPITLVANATTIPPVLMYATNDDSVPHQQAENMKTALVSRFPTADIQEYTMPLGTVHCFNYWHQQNTVSNPSDCVSHQVITFLQAHP